MLAFNSIPALSRRDWKMRETVLLSFRNPPANLSPLRNLSRADWRKLLHWLDTSGLALSFLDRIRELQVTDLLPPAILARLNRNLVDNIRKTRGMIAESGAMHREFQRAQLLYATLKGFSLWPSSVSKPWLRSQLDLDFLITESSAQAARQILERMGYHLHAISGRTWEFKTGHPSSKSLKDLYNPSPFRCVELHLETEGRDSLLARREHRNFHGTRMPVLSPADLFLGQGLHCFKHVCSEFSRTAHLVEFYRHTLTRRDDNAFWNKVCSLAEKDTRASLALGVVTLLIAQPMGDFAPERFRACTVDRLPVSARLWVRIYARRSILASFPGTKLYLLLQNELCLAGIPAKRSLRQSLIPVKLPPAMAHAPAGEAISQRIRRYCFQLSFILFRLRFHAVESLRYCFESIRWRRISDQQAP